MLAASQSATPPAPPPWPTPLPPLAPPAHPRPAQGAEGTGWWMEQADAGHVVGVGGRVLDLTPVARFVAVSHLRAAGLGNEAGRLESGEELRFGDIRTGGMLLWMRPDGRPMLVLLTCHPCCSAVSLPLQLVGVGWGSGGGGGAEPVGVLGQWWGAGLGGLRRHFARWALPLVFGVGEWRLGCAGGPASGPASDPASGPASGPASSRWWGPVVVLAVGAWALVVPPP